MTIKVNGNVGFSVGGHTYLPMTGPTYSWELVAPAEDARDVGWGNRSLVRVPDGTQSIEYTGRMWSEVVGYRLKEEFQPSTKWPQSISVKEWEDRDLGGYAPEFDGDEGERSPASITAWALYDVVREAQPIMRLSVDISGVDVREGTLPPEGAENWETAIPLESMPWAFGHLVPGKIVNIEMELAKRLRVLGWEIATPRARSLFLELRNRETVKVRVELPQSIPGENFAAAMDAFNARFDVLVDALAKTPSAHCGECGSLRGGMKTYAF